MSAWRDHNGGSCPVHEKALVRVRWANGNRAERDYAAGNMRWSRTGHPYDIAAYQVTSTEDVQ